MAFVLASGGGGRCFVPRQSRVEPRRRPVLMVASESAVKTEASPLKSSSPPAPPAETVALKKELLRLCEMTRKNGVAESPETKKKIVEAAKLLDAADNREMSPATDDSPMIDGDWLLKFTDTVLTSSGKFGPFVGRVMQIIDIPDQRIRNDCFIGPAHLSLTATWKALDGRNFRTIFKYREARLFGFLFLTKPFQKDVGAYWRMGYTDENLRVMWTRREQDMPEGIFVLAREDPNGPQG